MLDKGEAPAQLMTQQRQGIRCLSADTVNAVPVSGAAVLFPGPAPAAGPEKPHHRHGPPPPRQSLPGAPPGKIALDKIRLHPYNGKQRRSPVFRNGS